MQDQFSGSFDHWFERYESPSDGAPSEPLDAAGLYRFRRLSVLDKWQDGKQVELKIIEGVNGAADLKKVTIESLTACARHIRSFDHPGLARLLDFHVNDRKQINIICERVDGTPVSGVTLSHDQLIAMAVEVVNVGIYLQSLKPPVVLPVVDGKDMICQAAKIVFTNYELGFLKALLVSGETPFTLVKDMDAGEHSESAQTAVRNFALVFASLRASEHKGHAHVDLDSLSGELADDKIPHGLNNLYKVRAMLKRFQT